MQIVPVTQAREQVEADPIDSRIVELVDSMRMHRETIAALEAENGASREELRHLLDLRGENWSDDEGYARLVPDSVRISYDARALDDLIVSEPLHYGWLKDYRKTSVVRGSVQVR